jgi:hypothetical protein
MHAYEREGMLCGHGNVSMLHGKVWALAWLTGTANERLCHVQTAANSRENKLGLHGIQVISREREREREPAALYNLTAPDRMDQ